jgi:hypothetical protein
MPGVTISGNGTGGNAWQAWNYAWTTTSASANVTTITVADPAWQAWNTTASGAAWSGTVSNAEVFAQGWVSWNTACEESREQREERERLQAEARQRAEERRRDREAAAARAEELLLSLLTGEQARDYSEHGWFEVRGSRGGRWRIRNRGQSGNVDLMPEIGGEREATYCAHPPGSLPDADAYVAQMLHIVTDEDGFKRVANRHYQRPAA